MAATLLKWAPPQVVSKAKAASKPSPVEDLLDAVMAPRSYAKDDGSLFLQRISSEPATKTDVVRLQESLDQLLQQRQARETGICPTREALYSEAFGARRGGKARGKARAAGARGARGRSLPSPPPRRGHPPSCNQLVGARRAPAARAR